jgi:hypothetical protein
MALYRDRVADQAEAEPAAFAAGIVDKLGQLAMGREIPRNLDIYVFRQWSPLLTALVFKIGRFGFPFGLLFPLAALGLALRRRDIPAPLFLLVATYPLVIAATFVAGRYRVPLVPALSILAAAGVVEIGARVRGRRWRDVLVPTGLAASLLLLTNAAAPICEEEGRFESEMYLFVAMEAAEAGDDEHALESFRKALEIEPQWARAHGQLAWYYGSHGELDLALEHFDEAIRLGESHQLLHGRGNLHSRMGKLDLAFADFDRSIALNPSYSPAYLGRGRLQAIRYDFQRARADFRRSLKYASSEEERQSATRVLEKLDVR